MRQELYINSKDYINRWVISYADFVTILFALFIVMWALSGGVEIKTNKDKNLLTKAIEKAEVIAVKNPIEEIIEKNPQLAENFTIIKDKKGIILRGENTIFFDEGSAELKEDGIKILNELAISLKELNAPLIIEGHTDSTPINTEKYPSNWELSTARATNIVKYFIKHCGYTPNRLSAVGYGEFAPIVANDNVKNKAKNRRVDIILLDNNNYTEK
jgi:chemotaxis protein MotB